MDGVSLIIYVFGAFAALMSVLAVSYALTLAQSYKADR